MGTDNFVKDENGSLAILDGAVTKKLIDTKGVMN